MPVFRVTFFKEVLGDPGRDVVAEQGSFVIEADTAEAAVELAKSRFCEEQAIRDWSIHADRFEVETHPDVGESGT
jgi:hypothetical protein